MNKKAVNACILVVAIFASLLCAEVAVRIFFPQPYDNFFSFSSQEWPAGFNDWFQNARPRPKISFTLIPGTTTKFSVSNRVNNYGCLDINRKIEKNTNTFRVLVLGDSVTTEGYPPYPYLLEELLNKEGSYVYEVWNCAFPTYNTFQEKEFFKNKGLTFMPDMVLIGFCLNDFDPGYIALKQNGNTYLWQTSDNLWLQINPIMFEHSHLYRFIISRIITYKANAILAKKIVKHKPEKYYRNLSKLEYDMVYNSLEEIKNYAAEKGIPLFIIIFPYLKDISSYSPHDRDSYSAIVEIATKLNIPYLELIPYFEKNGEWFDFRYRERSWDDIHMNNKGHRLITEAILTFLLQSGLKDKNNF